MAGMIPTRIHGVLDYATAIVLIAAPWLFGFDEHRNATLVPVILGIGIILYSLLTDYELGLADVIPMPTHLILDALGGLVLIASPWIFRFSDDIWWPHVAVGLFELVVVALSRSHRADRLTDRMPAAESGQQRRMSS
jgi:SPW repeat-containing protein